MLFQMRFRMLSTLLLSLIVPAGSAPADMCFNFENCYKAAHCAGFQHGERLFTTNMRSRKSPLV